MLFKMRVRNVGDSGEGWWENYDKPGTDAEAIGRGIIDFWNSTLASHEKAREFLEAVVVDARPDTGVHDWEKTNSITIMERGRSFDTCRCKACGITAKRYGLSESVVIDPKYKAKVYRNCQTAKEKLGR